VAEILCPRCGHRNPLGSNFCSSCGFGLSQHPEDTTTLAFTHEATVEPGSPLVVDGDGVEAIEAAQQGILVVTRGPNVGARIPLAESRVTIGRHPESDVFLDDITVSRRHAEVTYSAGRYQIRDVGSLNGTYVNRQRVEEAWLQARDEVQVGKFKLVFMAGPAAGELS
jgi:pSer/pThr/pTyr-binding forkhead associated (FHA) protein